MLNISKIKRDILVQMLSWRTLKEHLTEHQRKKDLKLSSFNIYAEGKYDSCIHVYTFCSLLCFLCENVISIWKVV